MRSYLLGHSDTRFLYVPDRFVLIDGGGKYDVRSDASDMRAFERVLDDGGLCLFEDGIVRRPDYVYTVDLDSYDGRLADSFLESLWEIEQRSLDLEFATDHYEYEGFRGRLTPKKVEAYDWYAAQKSLEIAEMKFLRDNLAISIYQNVAEINWAF